jgi:hypothetical protein
LAVYVTAGLGVSAGASIAQRCEPGQRLDWSWCGDHVRLRHLPLRFVYNPSGAPDGLDSDSATRAAAAATAEWDRYWPKTDRTGSGCVAVCFQGKAAAEPGLDGINVIAWGDPASCPGVEHSALAAACIFFEGPKGAGAKRIKEVDIIVNPVVRWEQPEPVNAGSPDARGAVLFAGGEAQGAAFGAGPLDGEAWYDLQSALTHELGHGLGLEDIGNPEQAFPADLTDATRYEQVMYRWAYPRTTNKRSLHEGDIAGLQQVAARSRSDR